MKKILLLITLLFFINACTSFKTNDGEAVVESGLIEGILQAKEKKHGKENFAPLKIADSIIFNRVILITFDKDEILSSVKPYIEKNETGRIADLIKKGFEVFNSSDFKQSTETFDDIISNGGNVISVYNMHAISLLKTGRLDDAIHAIKEGLANAKDKGDKRSEVISLINLGNINFIKQDIENAVSYYKKGNEIGDSFPELYSIGLANLGTAYITMWDVDGAIDVSYASFNIGKDINDKKVQTVSAVTLSESYFNREEYNDAFNREPFEDSIKFAKEGLAAASVGGSKAEEAYIFNLLGYISLETGIIDDAKNLFARGSDISADISYDIGIIESKNGFGMIYAMEDNYKAALMSHTDGLALSKKIGYKNGEFKSLRGIGDIYYEYNNFDVALDYYNQALKVASELPNLRARGELLTKIGELYFDKKDYDNSLKYYSYALRVNRGINFKKGIVACLTYISVIYRMQREYELAIDASQKAVEAAADNLRLRTEKGISFNNMANVYMTRGNIKSAKEFFMKSQELASVMGDNLTIIDNLTNLGLMYQSEQLNDKAIKAFSEALALSKKLKKDAYAIENMINLGNYYRDNNNRELALENYELAISESKITNNMIGQANALALAGMLNIEREDNEYKTKGKIQLEEALVIYKELKMKEDIKMIQGIITKLD